MKKKRILIISIILVVLLLIILGFTLYKLNNSLSSFDQISFYTLLEYDDVDQIINADFSDEENPYNGKLYIPGEYNKPIRLFWTFSKGKEVTIKNSVNEYKTGEYIFDSNSSLFNILLNNLETEISIEVVRTSKNIEPLFINIDEPLGLINEMNNDVKHNISCYGTASFDNKTYYMSIKGRGNSTWVLGEKKPYNISFLDGNYENKQSVSMIDGIEVNKWSLLANYNDPTLLRNKIGYDLANEMSVGIESMYYDVWMNGNFLGNYLITPKNDYKASKDGYILEIDNLIDNENSQFHIKDNGEVINNLFFTIKDNGANKSVNEIQEYMQKAWDAIEDYESDDYLKYIDIDSWAKVYLLHEIYKNYDVVCGSILMHRDGQGPNDKLVAGPIWDLDNALGTLTPNPDNGLDDEIMFSGGYWYISSIKWIFGDYCFLQELGKHEDFLKKVQEIYYEYSIQIHNLSHQIEKYSDEGYDSFVADYIRWGNNRTLHDFYTDYEWNYGSEYPVNYHPTNTYDDYLQNLLIYTDSRINFLDENINNIK